MSLSVRTHRPLTCVTGGVICVVQAHVSGASCMGCDKLVATRTCARAYATQLNAFHGANPSLTIMYAIATTGLSWLPVLHCTSTRPPGFADSAGSSSLEYGGVGIRMCSWMNRHTVGTWRDRWRVMERVCEVHHTIRTCGSNSAQPCTVSTSLALITRWAGFTNTRFFSRSSSLE